MKRFFICAAAAIVALASCSKTEVVNTSAPEEIGFKAVTGAITKAEQTGTLSGDMGVYAFINGEGDVYFENIQFTETDNVWTGGQYWPLQSNLDFVVYSPYDNTASYATKKLTVSVSNARTDDISEQTDYLYGAEYFDGLLTATTGYNKNSGNIPTSLNHALAKVTLNFAGANVTVNSVALQDASLAGTYVVDYSTPTTPSISWSSTTPHANVTLSAINNKQLAPAVLDDPNTDSVNEAADPKTASATIMVVPKYDSNILIEYTIDGAEGVLDATIELDGEWVSGTSYTYNITITPAAIKFAEPTVNRWTSETPVDKVL